MTQTAPRLRRWYSTWLAAWAHAVAVALFAVAIVFPGAEPAHSQSSPTVTVPATISADVSSQTALDIRVGPPDAVPRRSFVRLRGLPAMAALSEGHSIAPGAWAVPLVALPTLKITLPAGTAGRSEFVVTLVSIDGQVLAAAKSTLVISVGRQGERESGAPASATILRAGAPLQHAPEPASTGPVPKPPTMTPEDRARALRMVKRADDQLSEGNIAGARLLYERAADMGLPEAAMAMAATYRASELTQLHAMGIAANPKEARRWYERARELGAAGAAEQLQRLGAN